MACFILAYKKKSIKYKRNKKIKTRRFPVAVVSNKQFLKCSTPNVWKCTVKIKNKIIITITMKRVKIDVK